MPKNGFWLRRGKPLNLVIGEAQMDRDATVLKQGSQAKTYFLPRSTVTVGKLAFRETKEFSQ